MFGIFCYIFILTIFWFMQLSNNIQICHEVTSDGASELLQDLVNGLDEASYQQYLCYHFYICEKPEFLGMSNHLLFVGTK